MKVISKYFVFYFFLYFHCSYQIYFSNYHNRNNRTRHFEQPEVFYLQKYDNFACSVDTSIFFEIETQKCCLRRHHWSHSPPLSKHTYTSAAQAQVNPVGHGYSCNTQCLLANYALNKQPSFDSSLMYNNPRRISAEFLQDSNQTSAALSNSL